MKAIKNIIIVGGGTSAWLTAAFLSHNCPYFSITVVDKEVGNPVGVGEGTIMNFQPFMENCGFAFNEWFPEISASYKSGILFPNWVDKGNTVWHPFMMNPSLPSGNTLHNAWSRVQHLDFKNYGLGLYDISINHNKIDPNVKYAFHVDAGKLVEYVQKKLAKKIKLIKSEMVSINRKIDNSIISLVLKDGQTVAGDLFVDCTGFKGLLNYNPIRNNLSDRLVCDTAVAGHVPYNDIESELKPYVVSEAVDHGWVWSIPVKTRIGTGLVFNRSITDIEEAKDYLVKYWDNRISKDNLKVIDWTPFYHDNQWHENVVAIGLSAGFIEPLESSGIALIMEGIVQLTKQIRDLKFDDNDRMLFNSTMKSFFEEAINFVSMHYAKTNRTEKFWQIVKETIKVTDEHQLYLDQLLDPTMPMPQAGKDANFFTGNNWTTWLVQMGYEVAPRVLTESVEESLTAVEKHYDNGERYRHIWGVKHHEAVDRISTLYSKYAVK